MKRTMCDFDGAFDMAFLLKCREEVASKKINCSCCISEEMCWILEEGFVKREFYIDGKNKG